MKQGSTLVQEYGDGWHLYNGDCVEVLQWFPDEAVDYCIFSPPFESLYTYSDDPRDMSNCRDAKTFWQHFGFLIRQLARIVRKGRLVSVHCMQIPSSKALEGYIGLKDFRGEIIRAFQQQGFIYHSEVCIHKDPVVAMQRTKALGLLHKQLKKDSTLSRQGTADYIVNLIRVSYIVTMRNKGENGAPVKGRLAQFYGEEKLPRPSVSERRNEEEARSIEIWQRYAEPVWMDIVQGETLSAKLARDVADERHIAPLQLTPIRRCVQLWSNKNEIVLTPFAGIGSELYGAVSIGRCAVGVELKPSYYRQAVANLRQLEQEQRGNLLDDRV